MYRDKWKHATKLFYTGILSLHVVLWFHCCVVLNTPVPLVLWWHSSIYPHNPDQVNSISCGDFKCLSTASREYLQDDRTTAVLFYGSRISPDDLPLPRKAHHQWALFHEESPMNNYMLLQPSFLELINFTSTFHRHSDFPLTTQNIHSIEYLTGRSPVLLNVKNNHIEMHHYAPILYVQSHCNVASDRDNYVKELMKYIDVDSFGKCLHNKDFPDNISVSSSNMYQNEFFFDFIANYKFHIAFENAICDDYITEKLLRPLHVGSVPIYLGSPSVNDWMPNNESVILTRDFKSPKELATFIKYVNENDNEYNKYLDFKSAGVSNSELMKTIREREWGSQDEEMFIHNEQNKRSHFEAFECHICRNIHTDGRRKEDTYRDGRSRLACPRPFPSVGDPNRKLEHGYWGALDRQAVYDDDILRALAVKKMVQIGESHSTRFWQYYKEILASHKDGYFKEEL